jgi:hypothetical protein
MSEERKPKPRAVAQVLEDAAPWKPAKYEVADFYAVRAVATGTANPDQQVRAMKWIIESCSMAYDVAYRPGAEDGRRDTDFCLGRQQVGRELVKMINASPAKLRRDDGTG